MTRWCVLALTLLASSARADFIDLEDLSLPPESAENGANLAGGFTSRGAFFNNNYDTTFGSWAGWAYSNRTDIITPGFGNQYSAFATTGPLPGSSIYGVAYTGDPIDFEGYDFSFINLPAGMGPESVFLTNTTYAALAMRDGDPFSKRFGGDSGNDPDFFRLVITGFGAANKQGTTVGEVEFFLADYRFVDNALDTIIDEWTRVDLSSLAGARSLGFSLSSTDNGPFGMNTPAYFALDNLSVVPEPGSCVLLLLGIGVIAGRRAVGGRDTHQCSAG